MSPDYSFQDQFGDAAFAAGDFKRDGKLDLALGGSGTLGFGLLSGNGDGTFRKDATGYLPGVNLIAADFNGDGKLDLAIESAVALGNGDGTFQPQVSFGFGRLQTTGLNSERDQYPPLVAADFNGDGQLDFAAPSRFTGTLSPSCASFTSTGISVFLNDSPGPATSVTAVAATNGSLVLAPAAFGSIDGTNLAPAKAAADPSALPAKLAGITLHVRDAAAVDRLAPLAYVSSTQINFVVPDGTAEGLAILNIDNGAAPFVEGQRATRIMNLSPSFFTADETGTHAIEHAT